TRLPTSSHRSGTPLTCHQHLLPPRAQDDPNSLAITRPPNGLVLHQHTRPPPSRTATRNATDDCTGSAGTCPVMRVTVLKAAAEGLFALLDYYAGLAEDQQRRDGIQRGPVDYYVDPNEPPGRWWGEGVA